MTGRNANIYFSETTYQKLRQTAGTKISRFVSETIEEKIQRAEQQKKEQLRKQLIKVTRQSLTAKKDFKKTKFGMKLAKTD